VPAGAMEEKSVPPWAPGVVPGPRRGVPNVCVPGKPNEGPITDAKGSPPKVGENRPSSGSSSMPKPVEG